VSTINEFITKAAQGGGNAMSFPRIGDYLAGAVVDRELIDDQHNPGQQILRIKFAVESAVIDGQALEIDHAAGQVVRDLYVRGPGLREAIGKAVVTAGSDSIEPGDLLRVEFTAEKSTGKGRPMKVFAAEFRAAQ
jgi:hypothetical protein